MSAASNSEARKRATAPVDPVEVVAKVEFDLTGPWFIDGARVTWNGLRAWNPEAHEARRAHASLIVAALRAEGLLT